jgi:hypothetical protein
LIGKAFGPELAPSEWAALAAGTASAKQEQRIRQVWRDRVLSAFALAYGLR